MPHTDTRPERINSEVQRQFAAECKRRGFVIQDKATEALQDKIIEWQPRTNGGPSRNRSPPMLTDWPAVLLAILLSLAVGASIGWFLCQQRMRALCVRCQRALKMDEGEWEEGE